MAGDSPLVTAATPIGFDAGERSLYSLERSSLILRSGGSMLRRCSRRNRPLYSPRTPFLPGTKPRVRPALFGPARVARRPKDQSAHGLWQCCSHAVPAPRTPPPPNTLTHYNPPSTAMPSRHVRRARIWRTPGPRSGRGEVGGRHRGGEGSLSLSAYVAATDTS
jgi:hypothetical protein